MAPTHHPITLLYCPFPSTESARVVARALLEAKLVACCNILPLGESHYLWHGKQVVAPETILIAKTMAEQGEAARQKMIALHPYEIPAILCVNADANPEFATWLAGATHSVAPARIDD